MCVGALNRGSCVLVVSVAAKALCKCVMLAASMSWWLRAWVLAATVGAGCKRGCCLKAWVLPANVDAAC